MVGRRHGSKPSPVKAAARALEVAKADLANAQAALEDEQRRLGEARGAQADTARALDAAADSLAAHPDDATRRRFAALTVDRETQGGIVAALARRCAAHEHEVAACEERLATAQAADLSARTAAAERELLDRVGMLDGLLARVADEESARPAPPPQRRARLSARSAARPPACTPRGKPWAGSRSPTTLPR